MNKKILSFLIAASLAAGSVCFPSALGVSENYNVVSAAASGTNVKVNTPEEIKNYILEHPFDTGKSVQYESQPSSKSPYALGEVSNDDLVNGLNALNCMRYIAGLDEVHLSDNYNTMAQAAALVNAANNLLTHTPDKPAGMSDELYETGASGTGSSNLSFGRSNFASAVVYGFMNDSSGNNITRVGHRRWCLNPSMQYTGFGIVDKYIAMYAFDSWYTDAGINGVCWPAQNMPVNYCDPSYIWSYSAGFRIDASKVEVTLTRISDSKSWKFSNTQSDGDFYINNDNYGQKGCVIFRPDERINYSDGDVFNVKIDGIGNGVEYTVNFFDLDDLSSGSPAVIKGDINDNGVVSAADLSLLVRFILDSENISINTEAADINNDNIINVLDVVALKLMLL